MKVLVIGGAGIIGTGIVEAAAEAGHDVVALSRQNTPIQKELPNVKRLRADWSDTNSAKAIINEGGGQNYDVIVDGLIFNREQLIRDLEILSGHCAQFVYISTAGVYEQPHHNASEDAPKRLEKLKWSYSHNKRDAEIYIEQNQDRYSCGITIIRPPYTYGRTRIPVAVVGRFNQYTLIDRMLKRKPIVFIDDGKHPRCVTHISTLAGGTLGTFMNKQAIGQAYHVCDDVSYTWEDVIETVGEIVGVKPDIVHVPVEALRIYHSGLYDEIRYNKMAEVTLDNSKIKAVSPGVNYRVPLREGLSETVRHLQENYSRKPLDEYFNFMCDAILARHKEFGLHDSESGMAEKYIRSLSPDYLKLLMRFTQMKKVARALGPVKRLIGMCMRK